MIPECPRYGDAGFVNTKVLTRPLPRLLIVGGNKKTKSAQLPACLLFPG